MFMRRSREDRLKARSESRQEPGFQEPGFRKPGFQEPGFSEGAARTAQTEPAEPGFDAAAPDRGASGDTPEPAAARRADDAPAEDPTGAPEPHEPKGPAAPPLEETLGLSDRYARRAEDRRARARSGGGGAESRFRAVASGAARAGGGLRWLFSGLFGGLFGAMGRAHRRARERGWAAGAAPIMIGVAIGGGIAATPPIQHAVGDGFERAREALLARPEYAIKKLDVGGARRVDLEALRRAVVSGAETRAAFAFDYAAARERIEALGWVERASVVLRPPHTLAVDIIEREPAALWRSAGELSLLDPTGVEIAPAKARAAHPTLPLLVGRGADAAVAEGLRLWRIAADGGLSVAAMTRIGGRRWDVELVGGPRLKLPAADPRAALERAVLWAQRLALLERGFEEVDLRLPYATTARPAPVSAQGPAPTLPDGADGSDV